MEEVKGTMKAVTTTQISIVGTTMETVMAADMIQNAVRNYERSGDSIRNVTIQNSKCATTNVGKFDKGLQAERIIGGTDLSGELMFLVK